MALTTETKVGLFTLGAGVVLALGVLVLGDVQFRGTYPLTVTFENADGLPEKGPIKMAGVDVGKVDTIRLEGALAKVILRVHKGIVFHQGAQARVATTGLIGSKYLEVTPGDLSAPVLVPGDSLVGQRGLSFDDVMSKLGAVLEDDPVHGSPAENLRVTLANFRTLSQALADSLGQQKSEMAQIVLNIRDMSAHAKRVAADLDEITGERKEDVKVALAHFRTISERLDKILANVDSGEGMLPRLLNDPKMGQELEKTMANVNKATTDMKGFMGRIADIQIFWDYRQRYDMDDDRWRTDLGLTVVPRPGKYYFIGGNNLGVRADRTLPGNDLERRNTATAVLGYDFGPLTVYGGAIRSAGGAGVRLRPLPATSSWHKRVELEAEAYNFGRKETIQGIALDHPVYNVGARVNALAPWVWVGAQWEDVAERKNINVNANLKFRDEDLAFFMGLVGLAR